jgi:hypothetical protein
VHFSRKAIIVLAGLLFGFGTQYAPHAAFAQGKDDKKQQDKSKEQKKSDAKKVKEKEDAPKPLFGGSLGLKSSRQSKDSSTMGFNGLDPQGKVEKSMLATAATNADLVNAKSLIAFAPIQKELDVFTQQGGLKPATLPSPAVTTKEKK